MSEKKRRWCAILAKLVAPMDAARAAAAFADMLPALPDDDNLFSVEAACRVARKERRTALPTFRELELGLLDRPDPSKLSRMQQAAVAAGLDPFTFEQLGAAGVEQIKADEQLLLSQMFGARP